MAFAAVCVISATRGLAHKAQRVVGLHLQRLHDVGEDARRCQHTVETKAVGDEVDHILHHKGVDGIVEAVAHIRPVVNILAVVVDIAVLQA